MGKNSAYPFSSYLRPLWLLDTALAYAIGAAIARYLGIHLDWNRYFLGAAWLLCLQLGGHSLDLYFSQSAPRPKNVHLHNLSLWIALAALSACALLTISFVRADLLHGGTLLMMALLVVGMMAATLPPLRLADSVYREVLLSMLAMVLIPALAFLLQADQLHRFVAMSVFPLMLLHTAALIVFRFPTFAHDLKYEKKSLLVRAGWQRGIIIINLLALSAFLLLGLALVMGFPPTILWPTFLVFPLALFQTWYLNRIASGIKPHWRALTWNGAAIYSLTTYLLLLGFLTH